MFGRTQGNERLNKFKGGYFYVRNEEHRRQPRKFEDDELQALHDEADRQMQK